MTRRIYSYKTFRRACNPTGYKYLADRQRRYNRKHKQAHEESFKKATMVRLSHPERQLTPAQLNERRKDLTLDYVSVYLANIFLRGLGADIVVSQPMETKSFFGLCQALGYTRKDFEWIVNQPINYLRNKEERKFLRDRLDKWWPTKNTP